VGIGVVEIAWLHFHALIPFAICALSQSFSFYFSLGLKLVIIFPGCVILQRNKKTIFLLHFFFLD
jgi:hypothetical protein